MEAQSMFSTLLQWLVSATGDEAKTGGVPLLDFPMPKVPLKKMPLSSTRPLDRFCCAMGQPLVGRTSFSLDPTTLWNKPHTFRARRDSFVGVPDPNEGLSDDGGTIGFVYTRHGGFIDLGHARDLIDYTRYFASMYRDVASKPEHRGDIKLFETKGVVTTAHMHLLAEQAAPPPDFAICALLGAKLAFEFSVWHEIESYFTLEKYSSFAPEDLFSNAVGVLAGFRALVYPTGSFDRSADSALKHVLELLGPVDIATTEAATQYVKDHWWKNPVSTLKRNFLTRGAIKPWLITDLAISGRELQAAELAQAIGKPQAASITIPTRHNDVFLGRRARLVFRNLHQDIRDLTGLDEITSINLQAVSTQLRDDARLKEGPTIDQP